ncbi:MAG: 50S ribosomal protein L29 [Candidatus Doudnabacteria bacterium]|nr:50S ribosomal protein L29 [Candidatus Doudnabacteria bacterium]
MKMQEVRGLKPEERKKTLTALREQVRDLRFKIRSKEIKDSHRLKSVKKDIARILTFLNEQ